MNDNDRYAYLLSNSGSGGEYSVVEEVDTIGEGTLEVSGETEIEDLGVGCGIDIVFFDEKDSVEGGEPDGVV